MTESLMINIAIAVLFLPLLGFVVTVFLGSRIKQIYKMDPKPIEYWFPPKWNINEVAKSLRV